MSRRDARSSDPKVSGPQKAIEGLLREFPGTTRAETAVRIKARKVIEEARGLGWSGPPFDPELLASLRGIRLVEGPPSLQHDALIRPCSDRSLEIVWNPTPPSTRRRFSIFHEIAHTLFPDAYETIHYRGRSTKLDPESELEMLCDIAAAEFLLPYPEFRTDLDSFGVSLKTMDALRERYEASREAVLLRMAGSTELPLAVAILRHRLKPTEARKQGQATFDFVSRPPKRLRIDLMVCSDKFSGTVMRKHKSVPDDSCVYRLLGANASGTVRGVEEWKTGKETLPRCAIEAIPIPPDGEGAERIAVLLQPT